MSTTDLPGSSLLAGRYRLVERLGAGGMSVVWRGFDEVLGRQVAVKLLPPSTSADPSFRRRLRAEAQAAARLSHPHITNVYDYGEATTVDGEAVPYVVMELVEGESLAAVLGRERRLPWTAAVRICAQVAAALAAAHARGIVHRDVTPANVMLTPSGAKVVDFGISALIGENDIDPDGSLLGTPAYLAPERLVGGQVSPATDVYAVGLLIYRTLIGQLPWDVGTTTALLRAHQYTEPDPLPDVDGLPPAVAALVARCLEKHPDDRPSSAEAAHVLAGISTGDPAGLAFVAAWLDSGEDTTILPSQLNTDVIARVRPGHARFAGAAPVGVPQVAAAPVAAAPVAAGAAVVPGPGAADAHPDPAAHDRRVYDRGVYDGGAYDGGADDRGADDRGAHDREADDREAHDRRAYDREGWDPAARQHAAYDDAREHAAGNHAGPEYAAVSESPRHVAVGRAVPAQRSAGSPQDPAAEPLEPSRQGRPAVGTPGIAHVAGSSAAASAGPVAGRRPDAVPDAIRCGAAATPGAGSQGAGSQGAGSQGAGSQGAGSQGAGSQGAASQGTASGGAASVGAGAVAFGSAAAVGQAGPAPAAGPPVAYIPAGRGAGGQVIGARGATPAGQSAPGPRNSRFAAPSRPAAVPTRAGPAGAAPAGAAPAVAGSAGAGPTVTAPAGAGQGGSDPAGSGSAGVGPAGVGPAGPSPAGVEPAAARAGAPVAPLRPPTARPDGSPTGPDVRSGSHPGSTVTPPGAAYPMASPPGGQPPKRPGTGTGGNRRPGGSRRRRVFIVLGAVLAVGAAGYAWSVTDLGRDGAPPAAGDQLLVQQGPRKCIVTYSVRSDTGKTFQAGLTVTNLTGVPVSDWVLRFVMPGDQTVSAIGKLKPQQEQHDVAVRSSKPIRPNSTAVMDVTGGYRASNAVPVAFSLKGETCDVFVSGKPGEPSRPVQRLVGGGTRLGPVPPAGVVLPGLTASPGGVIVTVPVTIPGPDGSTGPTRTSAPAPNPPDVPLSSSATASSRPPQSPPPDLPNNAPSSAVPDEESSEVPTVDDGAGVVILPPPLP